MATKKKAAKKTRASARPQAKAKAKIKAKPKTKSASAAKRAAAAKKAPASRSLVARRKPEDLRLREVTPSFVVNDLEKSLVFYRDVLGFVEKERWQNEGKLTGVWLAAGNSHLMIGQDDWKKGRDRVKGVGFRIYCTTAQDVDKLAARVKEKGATLDQEPTDMPWGRYFDLTDPDGFKMTICREK